MRGRARVVGAGVVGLTTAWCLVEDGWDVAIVAAEPPGATTSAVAAALWYPYLVGPAAAVEEWGRASRRRFDELAAADDVPVRRRTLHERFREPDADPGWRRTMPDAVREHVDPPFRDGWAFTTWVADMPRYLRWLVTGLARRGVAIETATVDDLADESSGADLVVDCAGVGARRLVPDDDVTPIGGQVVIVRAPWVTDVWLDPDHPEGPTYVIPRGETVVVGGTATPDAPAGQEPDEAVAASLLERAETLVPSIADAEVVAHAVGRRPVRPEVRVALEHRPWGTVLHHYGHGGAGVTLSWGSAAAATALARRWWDRRLDRPGRPGS